MLAYRPNRLERVLALVRAKAACRPYRQGQVLGLARVSVSVSVRVRVPAQELVLVLVLVLVLHAARCALGAGRWSLGDAAARCAQLAGQSSNQFLQNL